MIKRKDGSYHKSYKTKPPSRLEKWIAIVLFSVCIGYFGGHLVDLLVRIAG